MLASGSSATATTLLGVRSIVMVRNCPFPAFSLASTGIVISFPGSANDTGHFMYLFAVSSFFTSIIAGLNGFIPRVKDPSDPNPSSPTEVGEFDGSVRRIPSYLVPVPSSQKFIREFRGRGGRFEAVGFHLIQKIFNGDGGIDFGVVTTGFGSDVDGIPIIKLGCDLDVGCNRCGFYFVDGDSGEAGRGFPGYCLELEGESPPGNYIVDFVGGGDLAARDAV
eukprot:CAMPEP_0171323030 /NCGR_PEP_ID=MMETSP0816-20121228/115320_2 /TAXON_ID=420281 /ORGANISM="Proboscia inermis, Strain CCAP1064/1" /LENGTH=221 /DNA_ID=CAMNT_0011821639 /DNA_START=1191 /DNA_END=1855 /DNA_ORIENTATION=-